MLNVAGIYAAYGPVRALENVSLTVGAGQIVCLIGANGAGKSTTLNCISGLVSSTKGTITFEDQSITNARAEDIVGRGIVQVPEGREIFPVMTVEDNLTLGAWLRKDKQQWLQDLARIYDLFPRLRERSRQLAGTLSGGEQQMLMFGRALMAKPKLLMLDEPSLGLSPILVQQLFAIIKRIHADGMPILLVEQNVRIALNVSSYGYVIQNGEIIMQGSAEVLKKDQQVREAYLGG
jgi:branched-chain amino acid transport system ATP-binding protein